MSEYTSTREGYERAMTQCLDGSPEDAKDYDAYFKRLAEWRAKISDYKPEV
jgi:hypothetical protein